jgi:ferredoxin
MKFNIEKNFDVKENIDIKKRIIIGIHPYDIIAIQQADKIYLDSKTDNFYKKRRENTIIIGSDIQSVSPNSFSKSMGTNIVEEGFDLLITDLGNKYALTIGSEKGKKLIKKYAEIRDSRNSEIKKINKIRKSIEADYKKNINIKKDGIPSLLNTNYEHSIWEEKSNKCLECGSCIMVCPTCFCYDVKDNISLNVREGKRYRTWDGCLLKDFTKIGSGEVFREDVKERYRHRFYRKGNYLNERYGFIACVGCGRCGTACLPNIADPCDLINDLSSYQI